MRYHSTRGGAEGTTLSSAIEQGLAPDGGLFIPDHFPAADVEAMRSARSLPELAEILLRPFFEGDALEPELAAICAEAFDFPAPVRMLARNTAVLELFHGPTSAFKDFGARFLAAVLSRIPSDDPRPLTVLVATSGDTGGAVAAAFAGRPGMEVVVLYPKGMVSDRQERQLTCWGGNVQALRVRADFDACQRMVKEAFRDPAFNATHRLTSANSISLGRLLPQMVFYASASLEYERERGEQTGFIIPSGNLGNSTACYWAKRMGLPIREVVLTTNANQTLSRFVGGEPWKPRPTVQTLASAMDVGNPSNMERLLALYPGEQEARGDLTVRLVSDAEVEDAIRRGLPEWGEIWDPHTATAVTVREELESDHWVIVSTAHPAKFEGIVEPLIGRVVPVPDALAELLDRPRDFREIDANLEDLRAAVEESASRP